MSFKIVEIKPKGKHTVTPATGTKITPSLIVASNITKDKVATLTYENDEFSGVIASLSFAQPTIVLPCSLGSSNRFTLINSSDITLHVTLTYAASVPVIAGPVETVVEESNKKRKLTDDSTDTPKKAEKKAKVEETPKKTEKKVKNEKKVEEKKVEKIEPVKFASGLVYKDEEIGEGTVSVRAGNFVSIRYQGMLANGKIFDSNMPRGALLEFTVGKNEVIAGMDTAMLNMKRGGKRRMIIPPKLGYGAAGAPPDIPPNATLIFDVELVKVR